MVNVVPTFPERDDGQGPQVGALVGGVIGPTTEDMAEGVHAPGHMVENRHANEPGPDEGGHSSDPRSRQGITDPKRDGQRRQSKKRKESADSLQISVAQHVRRIALGA